LFSTTLAILAFYFIVCLGVLSLSTAATVVDSNPEERPVMTQAIRYRLVLTGLLLFGMSVIILMPHRPSGNNHVLDASTWADFYPLSVLVPLCLLLAFISPILALAIALYVRWKPSTMARRVNDSEIARFNLPDHDFWIRTIDLRDPTLSTKLPYDKRTSQYDGADPLSCFVAVDAPTRALTSQRRY
jgi:hypothetical protein